MTVPERVEPPAPAPSTRETPPAAPAPHRWAILGVIGLAQLMVILDTTIVNIALPSAQADLGFSTDNRQWVVTAYALSFGSLLLLGGRLSDLFGRRVTLVTGLLGFAIVSAIGGAAPNFALLLAARALQGVFAAILAPAALSALNVTFTEGKERARAFGVYAGIAGGGGVIGLILGGALTEWLSWRWCLYVNLLFAIPAAAGVLTWISGGRADRRIRIDIAGVLTGCGGLFCLVYGLSNAETDGWGDSLTVGLLIAAAVLIIAFVAVESRVSEPLLPLRIVADRNRGASLLVILIGGCSMFAAFLFLTYFLQVNLGYSPLRTGVAFLPLIAGLMVAVGISNLRLLPRFGPRPLVPAGLLIASGAMWWLSQLSVGSTYAGSVVGPILVLGLGLGTAFAPSLNAATAGIDPADAGAGSAMVNTCQQIGGAVGAAALSAVFTNAVTSYLGSHHPAAGRPVAALQAAAAIHGYSTAFTVAACIFLVGAIITPLLFRSGRIATTEGVPAAL
jgi:EmrB/QacA subfamily drug resistance transporter